MHGVSNHSLNLPSKGQVQDYLDSLVNSSISQQGLSCTEPVTVQVNKTRAVGFLFEKTSILFLSLSPHGMEDLPLHLRNEIEQFSTNRGYDRVLIVDCHNAMGKEISESDSEDLLNAAKSCLDTLITKETFPLEFGYANSIGMNLNAAELAKGGIGILCLSVNNKQYFLGWADSNNMENGVREQVVKHFSKNGLNLLEICTSDTHYSSGKVRNKNGYNQFGKVTKPQHIANWFLDIAKKSQDALKPASYEILENQSSVKVMGPTIFQEYSRAVDNCMKITKIFLLGSLGFFLVTMFL